MSERIDPLFVETPFVEPTFDAIECTLRGQAPDDANLVTRLISELMASGALDEQSGAGEPSCEEPA